MSEGKVRDNHLDKGDDIIEEYEKLKEELKKEARKRKLMVK